MPASRSRRVRPLHEELAELERAGREIDRLRLPRRPRQQLRVKHPQHRDAGSARAHDRVGAGEHVERAGGHGAGLVPIAGVEARLPAAGLGGTEFDHVPESFEHRVTYHDGCHGLRELRIREAPRLLLRAVRDLELVECDEPESCCGFGGLFSVKFPMISTAMAEVKGGALARTGCDYIVSSDPSCQLQLDGWLSRQGQGAGPRTIHIAEVLATGGA